MGVDKYNRGIKPLKTKLDKVFSRFIRKKYSRNGYVACYTCGVVKLIEQMQCGHFVSRQYLATRWDENNCRPQCVGCNVFGNGKTLDFEEKLKLELGNEFVEALKRKRHEVWKLDKTWYKEKILGYEQEIDKLVV